MLALQFIHIFSLIGIYIGLVAPGEPLSFTGGGSEHQ